MWSLRQRAHNAVILLSGWRDTVLATQTLIIGNGGCFRQSEIKVLDILYSSKNGEYTGIHSNQEKYSYSDYIERNYYLYEDNSYR